MPKVGPNKHSLSLILPDDMFTALQEIAAREHMTISALARRGIRELIYQHKQLDLYYAETKAHL